jgi:hypothetical protein
MTRLGAVFWLILVVAAGFTTFKVKYAVQDIEDELRRVRKQTSAEQQEIRVLTAEWTYLNQPERLADLNRRFLSLAPIAAKQMQHGIADVPLHLPSAGPDAVVAAAPEPRAPTPAVAAPAITPPLPITPAVLGVAPSPGVAPVTTSVAAAPTRPVKVGPGQAVASLDALIARIAEAR